MTTKQDDTPGVWHKALDTDSLPEGRAVSVTCGHRTLCLTHHKGQFGALDNRCPHQGGPLGEGTIEDGVLRCPWHGWDFDPLTGKAPGFDDGVPTFPVELRDGGAFVNLTDEVVHAPTKTDVLAETLENWGLRWVFGMVGHSNLGLADALRRRTVNGKLRYVGVRHEGAAAFACSAYGKLTGRPAACLAIAGPGATNLLTGLWDAHVDHAPVVALCGQVASQWLGRGNFQEVDLAAAFGGVARWKATLLPDSDPAELASMAVRHAILEEGPVQLIFPDDAQILPEPDVTASDAKGRLVRRAFRPDPAELQVATQRVQASKRPLIIVGHGARKDMAAIIDLANTLSCPVVTTFKAKGLIGDDHPLAAGVLGRSGTPVASWMMNEADLLLVLGASFSKHTGITPKIATVQIDRDALALGDRHAVDAPVQGDIGATVALLQDRLSAAVNADPKVDQRAELATRWALWRDEKLRRQAETSTADGNTVDTGTVGIHSASVFAALTRQCPADAVMALDVGNNTYSFGRYFETRQQAILMSGYLGSIGFGLPAAMGAWAATQEPGPFAGRKVISVSGDGGLGQYLAELTTLVAQNMDITHVVLNNSELGKISKEQRAGSFDVWKTQLVDPGFADLATRCGALGIKVTDAADLDEALARAIAHPGPALVEIITDAALL